MTQSTELRLEIRRRIAASAERLFEAWTTPKQLLAWWGPQGVRCSHAEIDLHVGGQYRLGNELPDGRIVFIVGEFLAVERPVKLVYTWSIDQQDTPPSRVSVYFNQDGAETEVVVVHERIHDEPTRDDHAAGWNGCLDGLLAHI